MGRVRRISLSGEIGGTLNFTDEILDLKFPLDSHVFVAFIKIIRRSHFSALPKVMFSSSRGCFFWLNSDDPTNFSKLFKISLF